MKLFIGMPIIKYIVKNIILNIIPKNNLQFVAKSVFALQENFTSPQQNVARSEFAPNKNLTLPRKKMWRDQYDSVFEQSEILR